MIFEILSVIIKSKWSYYLNSVQRKNMLWKNKNFNLLPLFNTLQQNKSTCFGAGEIAIKVMFGGLAAHFERNSRTFFLLSNTSLSIDSWSNNCFCHKVNGSDFEQSSTYNKNKCYIQLTYNKIQNKRQFARTVRLTANQVIHVTCL